MSERKVKIVKKAERAKRKPSNTRAARDSARKTATDMVATVTAWVNEFQEKQRDETSKAIENLIRSRQLNEA
jgi:hypothetical protein